MFKVSGIYSQSIAGGFVAIIGFEGERVMPGLLCVQAENAVDLEGLIREGVNFHLGANGSAPLPWYEVDLSQEQSLPIAVLATPMTENTHLQVRTVLGVALTASPSGNFYSYSLCGTRFTLPSCKTGGAKPEISRKVVEGFRKVMSLDPTMKDGCGHYMQIIFSNR